jgi:hypothetical protein
MNASCGMSTLPIPDSRCRGFREAHALVAFLLLVQQLALARHVAAVALRRHVLAERARGFAGA